MSSNQPGKPRIKLIDEAGTDATEAHAATFRGITEADKETEAHAMKFRGVSDAGDDATEGHAGKFRI